MKRVKKEIYLKSFAIGTLLGIPGSAFLLYFILTSIGHIYSFSELTSVVVLMKFPVFLVVLINSLAFSFLFYLYLIHEKDLSFIDKQKNNSKLQITNMESSSRLASLGEMASGFAHEINNPLSVISVNNLLLKKIHSKLELDEDKLKKVEKLTDSIDSTVLRISKIITSLRNLSKEGSAEVMGDISPQEILDEITVLAKVKLYSTGVDLTFENNAKDQHIHCSKIMMTQAIMNLISNSIEAVSSKDEKWIKIRIVDNNQNLDIIIEDSGRGIVTEIQEKIFDPMFTTNEIGKSLGLGLSLTKNLVEQQGGTITLDANAKNTAFVISIPKPKTEALKNVS